MCWVYHYHHCCLPTLALNFKFYCQLGAGSLFPSSGNFASLILALVSKVSKFPSLPAIYILWLWCQVVALKQIDYTIYSYLNQLLFPAMFVGKPCKTIFSNLEHNHLQILSLSAVCHITDYFVLHQFWLVWNIMSTVWWTLCSLTIDFHHMTYKQNTSQWQASVVISNLSFQSVKLSKSLFHHPSPLRTLVEVEYDY